MPPHMHLLALHFYDLQPDVKLKSHLREEIGFPAMVRLLPPSPAVMCFSLRRVQHRRSCLSRAYVQAYIEPCTCMIHTQS